MEKSLTGIADAKRSAAIYHRIEVEVILVSKAPTADRRPPARCRGRSSSSVSWCTRRRSCCRHQRNRSPLRVGTRNPPPGKAGGRSDQCLQAIVGLGDGVSEEGDVGAVGGDLAQMLDDPSRPLPDRITELTTAVVPVDPLAQRVASGDVAFHRRPHLVARQADPQRLAVELRHRLARLESELRIEAKRAIVVGRLQEPDPGDATRACNAPSHRASADGRSTGFARRDRP